MVISPVFLLLFRWTPWMANPDSRFFRLSARPVLFLLAWQDES
jgi:hypothetical protein